MAKSTYTITDYTKTPPTVTVMDKTDEHSPHLIDGDIWKGRLAGGHFEIIRAQRGVILIFWDEQFDNYTIANSYSNIYFSDVAEAMAHLTQVIS